MRTTLHELDHVRLRRAVGRWPAGTEGAVVNVVGDDPPVVTVDLLHLLPEAELTIPGAGLEATPEVAVEDLEVVESAAAIKRRSAYAAMIANPSEVRDTVT